MRLLLINLSKPVLTRFVVYKYWFKAITCERDFTPTRERIFELLTRNGHVRKCTGLSRCDDWFARQAISTG